MQAAKLLARQVAKCTDGAGQLDVDALLGLVLAAYEERDQDRRRIDRANRLMAEELTEATAALELQNIRFQAALENLNQGVCLSDAEGRMTVCNRRFLAMHDVAPAAALPGTPLDALLADGMLFRTDEGAKLAREHLGLDPRHGGSIEQRWPDGRVMTISRNPVADGGFLDSVFDVTESHAASARIAHLAWHDPLTGLPNRALLHERLSEAAQLAKQGKGASLLCLDLDRFKAINDTLGHPVGDLVLQVVGKRLARLVRGSDTVARLGGDEFAIVQQGTGGAEELAQRIVDTLSRQYRILGHRLRLGVSVGIAEIAGCDANPDEALRHADLALYQAKGEGRGGYRMFRPTLDAVATRRRQTEIDLRAALEQGDLAVHYQPQLDLRDGAVACFEALVRWHHPTRGMVMPSEFVAVAEESGLIELLGEYVLRIACQDAVRWPDPVGVAVNLSAIQFDSGRLVPVVRQVLQATGLPARRLEVEITENVLLKNSTAVLDQLRALKAMGVHVALDDFGIGYSSLGYLNAFPFDRVKIDRSFVSGLGRQDDSLAIVRAVSGMCSSLGILTTAEGVETTSQLELLRRERCDSVQGYLFSRPVPFEQTAGLLARLPGPVQTAA